MSTRVHSRELLFDPRPRGVPLGVARGHGDCRRCLKRWPRAAILTVVTVFALLFLRVGTARAGDRWTAPYPGVRYLHRVTPGVDLHLVLIDLGNPSVSLVATRPADRFTTVSEFARRYDAQVAINANFFGHGSCGLAMGDGEVFDHAYEDGCGASLAFGRGNETGAFDSLLAPRGPVPADWMHDVITGKPWLIRDGRATLNWTRPQHVYRPNPRTVAGVTSDRRTLVLLAADGRRPGVPGLTGFQLVRVLQEFGVTDAINLDGGGSTALVLGGRVRNRPSDRHERVVMTHLGVRIRDGGFWYAGEVIDHGGTVATQSDEVVPLWVDVRNTGRRTWRPVTDGGGSPTLELSDGATAYTASVEHPTPPGSIGRFVVRWLARAPGLRELHARLMTPDGEVLSDGVVAFTVAVSDPPSARVPEPPAVATASVGPGCNASPMGPTTAAWSVLGVLFVFGQLARTRRRGE